MTEMTDVHGVYDTRVILQNNTHIQLYELSNNTVLDTKSCQSFHRMNALADTVMCSDGIYSIGSQNLTLIHNGPISLQAQPKTNFTLEVNGNYQSNNPECFMRNSNTGNLKIMNGSNIEKTIQITFGSTSSSYESISIKQAFIHEESTDITLLFSQNDYQYACAPSTNNKIYTFDYNTTSSLHFSRSGGTWGSGFGSNHLYFDEIRNGIAKMTSSATVRLTLTPIFLQMKATPTIWAT